MSAEAGPTQFGANNVTAPALDGFNVTPSDTINENSMFRCVYVGGAGDIALITSQGTKLTFIGVPVGTFLPVVGIRINSTSTTATNLIGLV